MAIEMTSGDVSHLSNYHIMLKSMLDQGRVKHIFWLRM